jgi:hypothetical protein
MKNNFEWVVPVIVAVVFIVGNIMRILNWKNEQEKKTVKRPREFQAPKRAQPVQTGRSAEMPMVVEAVYPSASGRPAELAPRPLGALEAAFASRQKPRAVVLPEDVQKALRRNRAKAQKKTNGSRMVVEEVVLPVVVPTAPRQTRDDVPNVPAVVTPEGGPPGATALAMSDLVTDLFKSPDAVAKAMVLQVIFSPPLCKRR